MYSLWWLVPGELEICSSYDEKNTCIFDEIKSESTIFLLLYIFFLLCTFYSVVGEFPVHDSPTSCLFLPFYFLCIPTLIGGGKTCALHRASSTKHFLSKRQYCIVCGLSTFSTNMTSFSEQICVTSLSSDQKVAVQVSSHNCGHPIRERFTCDNLLRHLDSVHDRVVNKEVCYICLKVLSSMSRHLLDVNGVLARELLSYNGWFYYLSGSCWFSYSCFR